MKIHTAGRLRAVATGMAATLAIAGAPPAQADEHEQQRDARTPSTDSADRDGSMSTGITSRC